MQRGVLGKSGAEIRHFAILLKGREPSLPVLVCCALWLATAEKEGKQIRARAKEGERGGTHAREAVAREGWETGSSGLRLSNDPRDRARVAFGPLDSESRAELSVDAQFGSARLARRKGAFPCV